MPGLATSSDAHVTKRQRVQEPCEKDKLQGSRIFAPYRTVGLVSPTSVPFTSIPLGKTTFQLTTSTGRALHTYDLRRGLQLNFITRPQTPGRITATCAWKDVVLAAWGGSQEGYGIWVFKRGQRVAKLPMPEDLSGHILTLQIFGSWLITVTRSRVDVWKLVQGAKYEWESYSTLDYLNADGISTESTGAFTGALCSVPTLLNKILVGKTDGSVQIWNVRSGRLIYTILPPSPGSGAVTALEPSPAVGIVGIARADRSIILHDVVRDMPILQVESDIQVTSISFRTDGEGAGDDGQDDGVMATAGVDSGNVTLWDLNAGGKVQGVLRGAHDPPSSATGGATGGVSRVEFLAGQPVMVTTGLDNALKTWHFDRSPFNPVPRPLHIRSGHAAPVTRLRFLPTQTDGSENIGKWLISASRDRSLWGWSLRRDGQSTELSQGNVKKKAKKLGFDGKKVAMDSSSSLEDLKAPEITCIACNLNRDGGMGASTGGGAVWANVTKKQDDPNVPVTGWESMVTGHRGDKFARTWFWGRKKAGRWAFATGDNTEVTSVAMSPCGTFALVGSAGGSIEMFNLQSGIRRQKYPRTLTAAEQKALKLREKAVADGVEDNGPDSVLMHSQSRHDRDVTGILVDSMNRTIISSSLDGKIKFWDFMGGTLRHEIDKPLSGGFTACQYHRPSDLIALSCDDMSIQVVDIETKKTVRELWGCVGQINDFAFSNDGRWIVAASADSVIRVWDLPTGHLIDAVKTDSVCTSLSFSPTGEFLATSHAESIGVSVWSNRSLFKRVPTRHISDEAVTQALLPTASGEGAQGLLAAAFEEDDADADELDDTLPAPSIDQLSADMTTLSLVPRARWQTLLHLDLITQRNKPIEPPKAPEKAPFFLPSLGEGKSNPASASNGSTSALFGNAIRNEDDALAVSDAERSRVAALQRRAGQSSGSLPPFTQLLRDYATSTSTSPSSNGSSSLSKPTKPEPTLHEPLIAHLKTLAPAAADIEIRSLSPRAAGGSANELAAFVRALTARLRQRRDYEVVQAWMTVFLRIHGDVVTGVSDIEGGEEAATEVAMEVREELAAWKEVAMEEKRRIGGLVGYCGGVVQFLRSAR